jgi:hypothetical protein
MTASRCAWALLCLAVLLAATSARAADPGNYLDERFSPLSSASARVPAAKQTWFFRWERYDRSTQGRLIETLQIGKGPFRTLVLGSLHGSETMAVEIVEKLATHLGNASDHWHEINVLVVRTPNPDGFAKHNSLNARGVDLNRNFPTSTDQQSQRELRTGTSAFSEVETRALRELLATYRPHRVVHVKSTRNATGWALCSRRADATSKFLCGFRNLYVGRLENHLVSGSVESYAIGTLGLETITLAVPNRPDKENVWRDYRNVLLAAAAHVDPAWRTTRYQAHAAANSPKVSVQQPYGVSRPKSSSRLKRGVFGLSLRHTSQKKQLPLSQLWQRSPPSSR